MINRNNISKGFDWALIWLYIILVSIGVLCIFANEYKEGENIFRSISTQSTDYAKQILWIAICSILAIFILLTDSKFFTAMANLLYSFGILLLLLTLAIGSEIKGSKSWLVLGSFRLQPSEICKVFTCLALAKYISRVQTNFQHTKPQAIAIGIMLLPAFITIAQNETGLALVYFSFFLVMYREGLPIWILIVGFSLAALVVMTLLLNPNTLAIILSIIAALAIFILKKQIRQRKSFLFLILMLWFISVGITRFGVPYVFEHVLKPYQVDRIMSLVGKEYTPKNKAGQVALQHEKNSNKKKNQSEYNVKQSKIAIGSGGLLGKGYLKGTQTRYDFVPEQRTDFIFCTVGEGFGFIGSFVLLGIYITLLLRIIVVAERQRSVFSRVYAYGVASIFFFHIIVNICMTIGLAPVIGIPLPLLSYGGSSLIGFTALLFILIRLDADRQMLLR